MIHRNGESFLKLPKPKDVDINMEVHAIAPFCDMKLISVNPTEC